MRICEQRRRLAVVGCVLMTIPTENQHSNEGFLAGPMPHEQRSNGGYPAGTMLRANRAFIAWYDGEQVTVTTDSYVCAGHAIARRYREYFEPVLNAQERAERVRAEQERAESESAERARAEAERLWAEKARGIRAQAKRLQAKTARAAAPRRHRDAARRVLGVRRPSAGSARVCPPRRRPRSSHRRSRSTASNSGTPRAERRW